MNPKQTIVLTGFMGSGKSAVGRLLSERLGKPFRDLDTEIESGEEMSIPGIFNAKGEAHFRSLELRYLKQLLAASPLVLALGGGALKQQTVAELVQKHGILVYLKVPEDTLVRRLIKNTERPILLNEDGVMPQEPELRQKVRRLLAEREPLYRRCDVTVHVATHWSKDETTNEVIRILSQYAPAAVSENN